MVSGSMGPKEYDIPADQADTNVLNKMHAKW